MKLKLLWILSLTVSSFLVTSCGSTKEVGREVRDSVVIRYHDSILVRTKDSTRLVVRDSVRIIPKTSSGGKINATDSGRLGIWDYTYTTDISNLRIWSDGDKVRFQLDTDSIINRTTSLERYVQQLRDSLGQKSAHELHSTVTTVTKVEKPGFFKSMGKWLTTTFWLVILVVALILVFRFIK